MRPARLELHIEELVLHGFAPGDRQAVADALQGELARLFAERGLPSALAQRGEVTRLDAGSFPVAPRSGAAAVGAQVAQAVHGGLSR